MCTCTPLSWLMVESVLNTVQSQSAANDGGLKAVPPATKPSTVPATAKTDLPLINGMTDP